MWRIGIICYIIIDMLNGKSVAKNIIVLLVIILGIVLFEKSMLEDLWSENAIFTAMTEHKDTGYVYLNENDANYSQVFLCLLPKLKEVTLEYETESLGSTSQVIARLSDASSGDVLTETVIEASRLAKEGKSGNIKLSIDKSVLSTYNTKGMIIALDVILDTPDGTSIAFTANSKPAMVLGVDGNADDHSNIIYYMEYNNCKKLKSLYYVLVLLFLIIFELAYIMIVYLGWEMDKVFWPIALAMGMFVSLIIGIHGVPDEPWHIDTAYNLSNKLMLIDTEEEYGYTLKRKCDVLFEDYLANGVESNSYLVQYGNIMKGSNDKELMRVGMVDTTALVPKIVYLPAAIGIAIGRILGLPSEITYYLGGLVPLVVFVLLVQLAIIWMPRYRNVLAMIAILPITMQQAASMSYDMLIDAIAFMYVALAVKMLEDTVIKKWEVVLAIILTAFLAMVKGCVYLPLALLMVVVIYRNRKLVASALGKYKKVLPFICAGVCIVAVLGIVLAGIKFAPTIRNIMGAEVDTSTYTVGTFIKNPMLLIKLFGATFFRNTDTYLQGMLGGRLGWHDIKVNWMWVIINLFGLIMLANDSETGLFNGVFEKICANAAIYISMTGVLLSMLFAFTAADANNIQGVQGRYFLPVLPVMLMLYKVRGINVDTNGQKTIIMTMIATDLIMMMVAFAATI